MDCALFVEADCILTLVILGCLLRGLSEMHFRLKPSYKRAGVQWRVLASVLETFGERTNFGFTQRSQRSPDLTKDPLDDGLRPRSRESAMNCQMGTGAWKLVPACPSPEVHKSEQRRWGLGNLSSE